MNAPFPKFPRFSLDFATMKRNNYLVSIGRNSLQQFVEHFMRGNEGYPGNNP